jgi:hypothetical protein
MQEENRWAGINENLGSQWTKIMRGSPIRPPIFRPLQSEASGVEMRKEIEKEEKYQETISLDIVALKVQRVIAKPLRLVNHGPHPRPSVRRPSQLDQCL